MAAILSSLAVGALFGAGLAISRMMYPEKVIGFLDVAGNWDPTLIMVMIGALAAAAPGFALARRRGAPAFGGAFQIPTRRDIDAPLVAGAAVFGVGWGLAGFCPGPAIAALSTGAAPAFVFAAAMLAGMALFQAFRRRS